MNKRDIAYLERIHDVLAAVPRHSLGSQSQTAAGILAYAQDMEAITPWIRKALRGVALRNQPNLSAGVDYNDPEVVIGAMEGWIKARREADWKPPVLDVGRFVVEPKARASGYDRPGNRPLQGECLRLVIEDIVDCMPPDKIFGTREILAELQDSYPEVACQYSEKADHFTLRYAIVRALQKLCYQEYRLVFCGTSGSGCRHLYRHASS